MGIQDIKGMHNKQKKSAAGANVAHRKPSETPQIRANMVNAAFKIVFV